MYGVMREKVYIKCRKFKQILVVTPECKDDFLPHVAHLHFGDVSWVGMPML
jgi:hypothetical protein